MCILVSARRGGDAARVEPERLRARIQTGVRRAQNVGCRVCGERAILDLGAPCARAERSQPASAILSQEEVLARRSSYRGGRGGRTPFGIRPGMHAVSDAVLTLLHSRTPRG